MSLRHNERMADSPPVLPLGLPDRPDPAWRTVAADHPDRITVAGTHHAVVAGDGRQWYWLTVEHRQIEVRRHDEWGDPIPPEIHSTQVLISEHVTPMSAQEHEPDTVFTYSVYDAATPTMVRCELKVIPQAERFSGRGHQYMAGDVFEFGRQLIAGVPRPGQLWKPPDTPLPMLEAACERWLHEHTIDDCEPPVAGVCLAATMLI